MAEIEVGDVVLAKGTTGRFHGVVTGVRLGRLAVERCDGRASAPLSPRDVVTVYKAAGAPSSEPPPVRQLRPSGHAKEDSDAGEGIHANGGDDKPDQRCKDDQRHNARFRQRDIVPDAGIAPANEN